MAAKSQAQTNLAQRDSNNLVLYRLDNVEAALKTLTDRFDNQNGIKKPDLLEFRDTIIDRIADVQNDLQRQINDKAGKDTVNDLRHSFYALCGALVVFVIGILTFYITHKP